MNKNIAVPLGIVVIAAALGFIIFFFFYHPVRYTDEERDGFAQCLAEKNITMYGAAWCPHCQNEKRKFGDSFRFVPYVECPDNPQECLDAGINGYPTWIFPDGGRLEGEQGLEKLSQESGCALMQTRIGN